MKESELETFSEANRCPIFLDMTLDERGDVLQRLENLRFSARETILREGKTTHFLWIIIRGKCEVIIGNPGGEQVLAELDSGCVFGELSFFNPAPHSATVRAVTDVEIMRLSREDFDALEQAGSTAPAKIACNLVKVLAERLQRMDEFAGKLVEKTHQPAQQAEWNEFRSKLYSDWHY